MKKSIIGLIFVISILLLVSVVVFAGTYRSPSKDTTCDGSTCSNVTELATSASLGFGSTCVTDLRSYIGWDLTTDPGVSFVNAKLTLTTSPTDGVFTTDPGTYTFSLVTPNNHTWTAGGSDPGFGAVLATSSSTAVTAAGGEQVVFQSDALGTYFDNLQGGTASVGVVISSGCTVIGSTVLFQDMGSTSEPDLIFYTGTGGTPVTLRTFRATDPTPDKTLMVGLAGLAVVALMAALLLRRRFA